MQYKVIVRVWYLGEYALKKDDVVSVESIGDGGCAVRHQYFKLPVWSSYVDLLTHCEKVP